MSENKANKIDLEEFRYINELLSTRISLNEKAPSHRFWLDVGDDAAAIDGWLISNDVSVEKTHFDLSFSSIEQAVEKHVISNISDIASMGGIAKIAFLTLSLNRSWTKNQNKEIARAFQQAFSSRGICLLGGDTVVSDLGFFSTTLLGNTELKEPLQRSKAQLGDGVFVQGTLGKSAAGLWVLLNAPQDIEKWRKLVDYHLKPQIHENIGALLSQNLGVHATIDISDGLSSELHHIALASGVSISIHRDFLPIDPEVLALSAFYGLSPLDFALNGGEEYQILFTSSTSNSILYKELPGPTTHIGWVKKGQGVTMINSKGLGVPIKAQAWSHL